MTQLTIRNRSDELTDALKKMAKERRWSINQAANYFLMKGAGLLNEENSRGIGTALDKFAGSWSDEEAKAFNERVKEGTEQIVYSPSHLSNRVIFRQ